MLLVLNGFWLASYVAFNGDKARELAAQFLALAEKEGAIIPLTMGHRQMGVSLMRTGDVANGRAHFDQAVGIWDHALRPQATRTDKDFWVPFLTPPSTSLLADRSIALWTLGYPEAALADAHHVVEDTGDLSRFLAYGVVFASRVFILCGDYEAANAQVDKIIAWADEKGALFWKAMAMETKGSLLFLTGKPSDALQMQCHAALSMLPAGSRTDLIHR